MYSSNSVSQYFTTESRPTSKRKESLEAVDETFRLTYDAVQSQFLRTSEVTGGYQMTKYGISFSTDVDEYFDMRDKNILDLINGWMNKIPLIFLRGQLY